MLATIIPVGTVFLGIVLSVVSSRIYLSRMRGYTASPLRKFIEHLCERAGTTLIGVGIILSICSLVGSYYYAGSKSFIAEFKEAKVTIESQRLKVFNALERVTLTLKVVDLNAELAKSKYWNSTPIIGWYLPDELDDLESIQ